MYTQVLNENWQASETAKDDWIPAVVPGCIHTDLMAADRIPDPFVGDNEFRVAWVAETDWIYKCVFTPSKSLLKEDKIFLECEGLDTVASIKLNGIEIARADNMHRTWKFDVTSQLLSGENTLEIEFTSPVNHVLPKISEGLVVTPGDNLPGSPYLRKAMYQWGWDWAPKVPTSGIWRSIKLTGHSDLRISDIRVTQVHGRVRTEVSVQVEVERFTPSEYNVKGKLISPEGVVLESADPLNSDESCAQLDFLVDDPQLWWPNGYGEQPLYKLEIEIEIPDKPNPKVNMNLGLRSLELRQEDDEWGKSFYFVVNGVPIFCKGANWIPADQFPSRLTDAKYRDLIASAAEANMNMIRVWGGGIYEDDRFFDLCDEYGILVWQDFMFSCAHYPINPEMLENIRHEAVDNIRRIRHHASLALWCGNNEMEWGVVDWWPQDKEARQKEYAVIFHDLLPEVCKAEDPATPYWPSSPASPKPFDNPNSEIEGDGHYWQVWHGRLPFTAYRNHYFRFMSEFGFQSLPSKDSVKGFAEPDEWNVTSYTMERHQKHQDATGLILYYFSHTFRFPKDFAMMSYASQVLQAEAIRYGVEHWRRNRNNFRCMGTLYWQLNDCWPVASWSSIEFNHRWKALHYYSRRFFAPVTLSAEETESSAKLHVTNDMLEDFIGEVRWSLEKLDGERLDGGVISVNAARESSVCVCELDFTGILDIDLRRETALIFELWKDDENIRRGMVAFSPMKHMKLPTVEIQHQIMQTDKGIFIELSSDNTARFVMLDVPGHRVRFSDNYFDIPAGRNVKIEVRQTDGLTKEEIAGKLNIVSLRDSY